MAVARRPVSQSLASAPRFVDALLALDQAIAVCQKLTHDAPNGATSCPPERERTTVTLADRLPTRVTTTRPEPAVTLSERRGSTRTRLPERLPARSVL